MEGGPGLDILSLLSQLTAGDTGGALRPGLGQPLGGGGTALGPSAAGFDTANPFFQTIGQQGIAGQTAGQMRGGQGSQGSLLGLLKALASVGQKGAGLFQSLQQGGGGGGGGERGFSTPGEPGLASPTITSDPFFSTLFQDPAVRDAFFSGQFGGFGANFEQGGQFGPSGLGLDTQSIMANAPFGPENGGRSPFGNIGPGDVGAGFGALGSLAGLAQDIQRGSPGGAVKDLFSLYSQAAPLLSKTSGVNFPTFPQFVSQLGDLLGLGSAVPAFGQGLGSLAGATGSEIGSALASGGLAGGTAAAESGLASAGGLLGDVLPFVGSVIPLITSFLEGGPQNSTQAANLAIQTAAALAAPFTFGASEAAVSIAQGIEDILNGASAKQTILDFGGLGFLNPSGKPGQQMEFERNVRNIRFAEPIISQGARLPAELQAAERSGDPAQIARLVEQARYISDQGPALSQVQPGIRGWGDFKNPFAGNQRFSQTMSQDMHNAFNAYARGIADLQRMGTLTPNAAEGTLMFNGRPMFGGSSPIAPQSLFNMMGGDPFGYGALYQGWFPPSIHGRGGGGGWSPPPGPAIPPQAASGGLLAPSGPNANTAAFQQMIQQNLAPLGIQSASLMAPSGPNAQTAQFLQMLMQNLGPLGIQVA